MANHKRRDPAERFWEKVEISDSGCWLWMAATFARGYGEFHHDGGPAYAHRWAYEALVGPIPDGLDLDHTCHNADLSCPGGPCSHRRCVNPDHLEPVTHIENMRRGRTGAHNTAKTHCPQGHPYSGPNLYVDSDGRRRCRACLAEANRRYHERKRAAA